MVTALVVSVIINLGLAVLWRRMRGIAKRAWSHANEWEYWWRNTPDGARLRSSGLILGHPINRLRDNRFPVLRDPSGPYRALYIDTNPPYATVIPGPGEETTR